MRPRGLWPLPLILLLTACAAKVFTPPSGTGIAFPDYAVAFDESTAQCRGARTMRALLSLSGRAGSARLRGQVDAGFAAPGEVRLEGRAPFGRPAFILVARNTANATLVLPRDNRVLRDAPPAAIVEALAGVALDPDELRSVVAGCGLSGGTATGGRAYGDELVAIDAGSAIHYLKRVDDGWRLSASVRGPLTVEYRDFQSGRPATIRMRTSAAASNAPTDLTVRLSDVDINVPFDPAVFQVQIPEGADPLTLEELRRAGPLGTPSSR